MLSQRSLRWIRRALAGSTAGALLLGALPTQAAPWAGNRAQFASPRFEQVWNAADRPVQLGQTQRSWTWGPSPWFDYKEFYKQAPNGLRQVQYFDKSRMEINNPGVNTGPLNGVTNGLLPVELIAGRVKLGDATSDAENTPKAAAEIPIAGDPAAQNAGAPTYASFRGVATTDNAYKDSNKVGQRVGQTFTKGGAIGFRQDLADKPGTDIVVYETTTGHNVPRVFNDFRNAGPVAAIAAFGYPITDAYWITAKVGGQDRDILVQVFERRVVTYTPSNPAQYQVEMGNVGQHYFQWRYPELGTPWNSAEPNLPIVFASKATSPAATVSMINPDGTGLTGINYSQDGTAPFSVARSWNPSKLIAYGDTPFYSTGSPVKRQLARFPLANGIAERILTSSANDYNPAVSPDGTKIAFASDRDGNAELYVMNVGSTAEPTRLTDTIGCVNDYPTWLPDGSGLVYESNCVGNFYEIYRGALNYTQDKPNELTVATLISPANATRLTNNNTDDRYPRVSPDGSRIAFTANRDGNAEIYLMTAEGGQQTRITSSSGIDETPTWSPDGQRIAFSSNRDGDYEIFVMNRDGSGQVQLTNNGVDDRSVIWAQ